MKSPIKTWPRSAGGIENGQRRRAEDHAQRLLGDHREPEGQQQREDRDRSDRSGGTASARSRCRACATSTGAATNAPPKPMWSASSDGEIGADGIERAMRQIDDAAEREDQRQAERDQQIVDADEQAVEDLLEDQDGRMVRPSLDRSDDRARASGSVSVAATRAGSNGASRHHALERRRVRQLLRSGVHRCSCSLPSAAR